MRSAAVATAAATQLRTVNVFLRATRCITVDRMRMQMAGLAVKKPPRIDTMMTSVGDNRGYSAQCDGGNG